MIRIKCGIFHSNLLTFLHSSGDIDAMNSSKDKSKLRHSLGSRKDFIGKQLLLNSIELFNFKSFEGHHIVGPFLNFTSIVGPNGGGNTITN